MNKTMKITGGVFAGLLALGVIGSATGAEDEPNNGGRKPYVSPSPSPKSSPAPTFEGTEVVPHEESTNQWAGIAAGVWAAQDADEQANLCIYYRGDRKAALKAITDGFNQNTQHSADDTADMRAAIDAILSREC